VIITVSSRSGELSKVDPFPQTCAHRGHVVLKTRGGEGQLDVWLFLWSFVWLNGPGIKFQEGFGIFFFFPSSWPFSLKGKLLLIFRMAKKNYCNKSNVHKLKQKQKPALMEALGENVFWFCSLHRVCVTLLVAMVVSFFNYCFVLFFVSEIPLIYLISIV